MADAKECVDFLNSVAESWPAAGHKAEILENLVKEYHPQSQSTTFEQSITLGQGIRRGSSARAEEDGSYGAKAAGLSPVSNTAATTDARGNSYSGSAQSRSMPVGIPPPAQMTDQSQSVNPMLATSNQSTGYPSMPWSLLAQTQPNVTEIPFGQSQSFGMSPPPAPLPNNATNEEYTDPFLYSLLNHITLPPHVPQPDTSPGDFSFMPQAGWSPAMPNYQQAGNGTNYDFGGNNTSLAQLMGMASSHQGSDRRFSNTSGALDPSDRRQTQSPKEMQWNGYFGSS